jgi:hypothetical protein
VSQQTFGSSKDGARCFAGFAEPQRAWCVIGESGVVSGFEALRSDADSEFDLFSSSKQSVSRGISPPCVEKPAVAGAYAGFSKCRLRPEDGGLNARIAVAVGLLQLIRLRLTRIEPMQWMSLGLVVVLGSATMLALR